MTTLSLRGNNLTNVAIKNFYSVLSSGENRTLRVLDISDNPGIETDVSEAFETFMEQRAVKRMLTLKAEKAKRIARGMPLLNEMLEEEREDDWRIGSGVNGGRRRSVNGSVGCCGVTVVCRPGIIDGTFHNNNGPNNNNETAAPQLQQSSSTGNSFDTYLQSEGSGSRPDEELRGCYDSVLSDITGMTGIGYESHAASPRGSRSGFDTPSPQKQQQQQQASYLSQSIGPELYPQSQQKEEEKEEQGPMPMPSPQHQRSNRQHFDPNYSMASSQVSSNDSSTSNTGSENLDQRQRQQLATLNSNHNTSSSRRNNNSNNNSRSSNNHHTQPPSNNASSSSSSSQYSTSSRTNLQISAQDYFDPKATERELRRQLATQGQAIGAYAIDDEAPHRQEVRGRRARVSRTESQRRARLLELSGGNNAPPPPPSGTAASGSGGGAVITGLSEGGDNNIVDADIERMEEYEYRNLSLYHKFFYKIGLDGDDNKTERVICLTFGVCILVLLVAIILYVVKG